MANKLIQHGGAAAATAAGGPIAGAAWEIGYPIVENWLTGGSGQDKAAAQQQAGMQQAKDQYAAYRPVAQQARQQATQQQLSAYNGAANAMNLMYGTAYDPRNYAPNLGKNPLLTGANQGVPGSAPPTKEELEKGQYQTNMGAAMSTSAANTAASSSVPGVREGASAFGFYGGNGSGGSLGTLPQEIEAYAKKYGQAPSIDAVNDYVKYGVWSPPIPPKAGA